MSDTEVIEKPAAVSTDLVLAVALTGAVVYAPGGVDRVITALEAEVRAIKTDVSTPVGRKAIASLAYKVAQSKTALDKLGKELTESWRKRTAAVNAERKTIETRLDALRDEVRKPLDDFEAAEADRIRAHHEALNAIGMTSFAGDEPTVAELEARLEDLAFYPGRDWQEFGDRAKEAIAAEITKAKTMLDAAKYRAIQAAEEAKRRAEEEAEAQAEADRQRAEREQRIADEAAANAKADAERATQAERDRLETERQEAEARAQKAEQERQDAATAATLAREQAQVEAERRQAEAVEAERKRSQEAREAELAAAKKREANIAHQRAIHREVAADLVKAGAVADEKAAHAVIVAIAKQTVRHVAITY